MRCSSCMHFVRGHLDRGGVAGWDQLRGWSSAFGELEAATMLLARALFGLGSATMPVVRSIANSSSRALVCLLRVGTTTTSSPVSLCCSILSRVLSRNLAACCCTIIDNASHSGRGDDNVGPCCRSEFILPPWQSHEEECESPHDDDDARPSRSRSFARSPRRPTRPRRALDLLALVTEKTPRVDPRAPRARSAIAIAIAIALVFCRSAAAAAA